MFSKACEYGIKAAIFIATNSFENRRVSPKEISEEIELSDRIEITAETEPFITPLSCIITQ